MTGHKKSRCREQSLPLGLQKEGGNWEEGPHPTAERPISLEAERLCRLELVLGKPPLGCWRSSLRSRPAGRPSDSLGSQLGPVDLREWVSHVPHAPWASRSQGAEALGVPSSCSDSPAPSNDQAEL